MFLSMKTAARRFVRDEAGAVTVDWVVLSAAVIGLGMVVLMPIAYSSESTAGHVGDYVANTPVGYGN